MHDLIKKLREHTDLELSTMRFSLPPALDRRAAAPNNGTAQSHLSPARLAVRPAMVVSDGAQEGSITHSFRSTAISSVGRSRKSAANARRIVIVTRSPSDQLTSNPDVANAMKPADRTTVVVSNA